MPLAAFQQKQIPVLMGRRMRQICTIGQQLNPTDPGVLARESANDPVISNVIRCTREGWPERIPEIQTKDYSMENFRKISMSLSVAHGCLLNGSRVQPQVLQLLHLGHFGIQRMKPYSSILASN